MNESGNTCGVTVARGEHCIRMEGKETYRFATKTLASSALAAIERAGLHPDEIDLVIPHQANLRIIETAAEHFQIPPERCFNNLARYGNTAGASVPICLHEALAEDRIKDGDLVMLVAFGTGFSWGATLLRW